MNFKNIKNNIINVNLHDWFLLIFMLILMIQTAYNLFCHELQGNSSPIDSIIRTTLAGLFGYYIGNGTKRDNRKKKTVNGDIKSIGFKSSTSDNIQNSIPSSSKKTNKFDDIQSLNDSNDTYDVIESNKDSKLQIVVIGTLGIVSLILLIITRNLNVLTVEKIATISQLRDFVSGSTGFLISRSKK